MYFLEIHFDNAALNGCGRFIVPNQGVSISKWKIFGPEKTNLEILQMIALATADPGLIPHAKFPVTGLFQNPRNPLRLEFLLFQHAKTEASMKHSDAAVAGGAEFSSDKSITRLPQRQCRYLQKAPRYSIPRVSNGSAKNFLLAYGPRFQPHIFTDDFRFNDPFYRLKRFHSLFDSSRPLTDPVAFLELLQYRGLHHRKIGAHCVITKINLFFEIGLGLSPAPFSSADAAVYPIWRKLTPWHQRMAVPVIDVCRHLYDAFPKIANPFAMPGVMLFHRPDLFCTPGRLVPWLSFMDELLPNFQFFLTLAPKNMERFPAGLTKKTLSIRKIESKAPEKKPKRPRLPKRPVLLIQVDGRLPNLALMKLSRYYKEQGREVVLKRSTAFLRNAEMVYASSIFNFGTAVKRVKELKAYYGDTLQVGGSGVDLHRRLPESIECLPADYTLYPELEDRAMGFITRGCPHHCSFCIVPEKEGPPHRVADIGSLLDKTRSKLILLDDNILSHPEATAILEEMVSRNLKVNFTQTLDLRYINREKADLLRRIDCMNTKFTRPNYYFSLNNNKRFATIQQKYRLFDFKFQENVEFVCMYGFDTTLSQDLERFRFLRSLPGAYVFVQEYKPLKSMPVLSNDEFFDGDDKGVDRMLDELVRIMFPQNMKSMEKYYKWVSRKYARKYGRLHTGLVDTIFRYNNRNRKGHYIATLAGTRN